MSAEESQRQPTEEEVRAALEEQLKKVRVEDVVVDAAVSILNLSAMRAGVVPGTDAERDLEQARIGIDSVRALMPIIEQVGGERARPLRDALAQLQLAYVQAKGGASGGGAGGGGQQPPQQPRPGEPGPAQRSGRLWVPGQ